MTAIMICAQCGQVIVTGRYFVAGLDRREPKVSPPCVYVCAPPEPCFQAWAKANPSGIMWADKATPTIAPEAPTEARGAFLDAKG